MGQRTKGRMWCSHCNRPVLGVKTTHRVRNAASIGGAMATGGLSLLGTRVEGYYCPSCGGRVHPRRGETDWVGVGAVLALVALGIVWMVVVLFAAVALVLLLPLRLANHGSPTTAESAVRSAPRQVAAAVNRTTKVLSSRSAAQRGQVSGPRRANLLPQPRQRIR